MSIRRIEDMAFGPEFRELVGGLVDRAATVELTDISQAVKDGPVHFAVLIVESHAGADHAFVCANPDCGRTFFSADIRSMYCRTACRKRAHKIKMAAKPKEEQ